MIAFDYSSVNSISAAWEAKLKFPNAEFIAGGTNLVDLMKKGVTSPGKVIDISHLPLKSITEEKNGLRIGALATNADVAEHPTVRTKFPLLRMAILAGASVQLRNMATVGGNIMQRTRCPYFYDTAMPCNKRNPGSGCGAIDGYNRMHAVFGFSDSCIAVHPSDMCVALAALDTIVNTEGKKGKRQILITQFHRLPEKNPEKDTVLLADELIASVFIPENKFNKSYYLKIRDRQSFAFALVSVAVALHVEQGVITDSRLAMGGVAPKPWRLYTSEKLLNGKKITPELFREAGEEAMRDASAFKHNAFKIPLGKKAVTEALKRAVESSF
ncbi:MAG: xanthine dehydrogenase family protein subunit M [Chitinophagaceae bacterium]|nr:xanthine dehydrogenase family protein subunit M [Chitinophagaceae bacterium]